MPEFYLEAVQNIETIFMHQTVFDCQQKCLVPLTLPKDGVEIQGRFVGHEIPLELCQFFISGMVDKKAMQVREPFKFSADKILDDLAKDELTTGTFYYLKDTFEFMQPEQPEEE